MNRLQLRALAMCLIATGAAWAQPLQAQSGQATHWRGITAEFMELRRAGNSVVARVRLRNVGAEAVPVAIAYANCYLLDSVRNTKYAVLHDDGGTYVALVNHGNSEWTATLAPEHSAVVWMRFELPAVATTSVSVKIDHVPPFDGLSIQDLP